jgi:hypothetical protein
MAVISIVPKKSPGVDALRVTADYLHSTVVMNATGATLPAGMAVYAQQSDCGCHCEIYPADPRIPERSTILGILPANVFNGRTTRVAVGGTVPYLLAPGIENPTGGSLLYLDSGNPGYLSTSVPDGGAAVVEVGTVAAGKLVLNINKVLGAPGGGGGGGGLQIDLGGGNLGGGGGGLNLDL